MRSEEVPASAWDKCSTCHAHVIWTVTESGKRMMVEPMPGGLGDVAPNLALTVVGGEVRSRVVKPHLAYGNLNLHLSHFVRCPQASKHRVRRRSHADRRMP